MPLTLYQEEWLNLLQTRNRLNIPAFRSSGKTELFLIDYPIFKMFSQKGWQGILLSSSLPQATETLRRIRDTILSNEILRTAVPDNRSATWSKTEIELKNGARALSKPSNENIRGYHVDYIGGDELGEWKKWDIITKTIPPMVTAKKGQIVYVGTPTSEIDFIHKLEKNQAYVTKWYPATAKNEAGDTLWNLRYPDTPIGSVRREYDSLSWSREFLLKPLSAKDKLFPYQLIEPCFNYDAAFEEAAERGCTYFIGLDFALSGEAGADYTVMTILKRKDDKLHLVNILRYKGLSYQAQKYKVNQLHQTYGFIRGAGDEGTFGKAFIQDLIADKMPIEGFKFTNQSKQDLITNLRRMFEKRDLIIHKDKLEPRTHMTTEQLVKELNAFGVVVDERTLTVRLEGVGAHDDMVFSLALAVYAARGFGNATFIVKRRGKSGIRLSSIIRRV